ncbi:hypothetical protein DICVIV_04494 [Dictyocaulus viviparus]|uniref:Uncharacterized protein n=1 Tax=Dictyocaulus viviparus TaxID=29172 RepID=A0A0D8Y006_DICVI|nr:hypothetical protein DICVIV_04494 [Dictyocaulus viviparus]
MGKEDFEFPDSTVDVKLKFDERDMKALDETESTDASNTPHSTVTQAAMTKFNSTLIGVCSFGFFIAILNQFTLIFPTFVGFISIIFAIFLYEWQRMYSTNLTRHARASFNFKNLLEDDANYIPFYTLTWLFGEKYKPYVIPCNLDSADNKTADEPEAVSPRRGSPLSSMPSK